MTKNNEYEDTAYYIICLERSSNEDSLLFWKPGSAGYTSDIHEAGTFSKEEADNINKNERDIALTKTELFALGAKNHMIVRFNLDDLKEVKCSLKKEETGKTFFKNAPGWSRDGGSDSFKMKCGKEDPENSG